MRLRLTLLVCAFAVLSASAAMAAPPNRGQADAPPSLDQAQAAARAACQAFKANFADNREQFGRCVAAGVRVRRTRITPHQACGDLGLSRKRQPGQRRSDFNACVVAAAHGTREGEEGEAGTTDS